MEKAKKKNKIKSILIDLFIFLIFIVGIWKIIELGLSFKDDKKEIMRSISVVESVEMTKDISNLKIEAFAEYKADYMEGFKKLDIPLTKEEQEFLYMLSKDYNISYPLLLGIIDFESDFDSDAISESNDYGLMQINSINHSWLKANLNFEDILDPYNNMRSGCYILSQLYNKYDTENKVLMAYNMGESGARTLWDKGVYSSNYSDKVLNNKLKYEELLD